MGIGLVGDGGDAACGSVETAVLMLSLSEAIAWLTMVVLLLAAVVTVVLVLSLLDALSWLTMALLRWMRWRPSCW